MTADSELFVDEIVRDELLNNSDFQKVSDNFGRIEVPREWQDKWAAAEFPDEGTAKVFDENDKLLGFVSWKVKFDIEKDMFDWRYIVAEPYDVSFVPTERYWAELTLVEFGAKFRAYLGDSHEGRELTEGIVADFYKLFKESKLSFNEWIGKMKRAD